MGNHSLSLRLQQQKPILFLSNIENLKIVRTKVAKGNPGDAGVDDQEGFYDIVCSSRDINSKLESVENKIDSNDDSVLDKTIGFLREISLSGVGNKRVFTFVDEEVSEFESGEYTYGLEITIRDPTTILIKTQIKSLEFAKKIISRYYK